MTLWMFNENDISPKAVAAANTTAGKPNEERALNIASVRPASPGIFFDPTGEMRVASLADELRSPTLAALMDRFTLHF